MKSPPATDRQELRRVLRSVVKVLTVSDAPDFDQPWQTRGATSSAGSGAIVDTKKGPRVLTNAHCVENFAFVEVRRYGNTKRFVAEVEAIGYGCDLALLSVADSEFFAGTEPIELGELPELSDQVSVCGYPIGGERLSITNGVVSRVEIVRYAHRQRRLLAIQIDAAINAGNSGGPVLKDGTIVGVAFQALEEAEQIGYMVAVPVIEHFLADVEHGVYDGFPALGISVQPLESDALRRSLDLPEVRRGGVLIYGVAYGGSAWGILREGDVLLEIDGVEVAADSTVPFRSGEMLPFTLIVSQRRVGDTINLRVFRAGHELSCVVRLAPPRYLVEEERYDQPPSYYIIGGLLLAPLTRDYLKTWDNWWQAAPRQLVALYERGIPTPEREEPVVLQKVLAHRINQGYHNLENILIQSAQGVKVRSLQHLIEVVEGDAGPFIELVSEDGLRVVLDRKEARTAHDEILKRFRVPADRSEDLRRP